MQYKAQFTKVAAMRLFVRVCVLAARFQVKMFRKSLSWCTVQVCRIRCA